MITNAVQHAFPAGREGQIWVRLAPERDRRRLTIRDSGPGIGDCQTHLVHERRRFTGPFLAVGAAEGGLRTASAPLDASPRSAYMRGDGR